MYEDAYNTAANTPLTNKQWKEAHEKAEKIRVAGLNTSSDEFFALVDKYYIEYLPKKAEALQEENSKRKDALFDIISAREEKEYEAQYARELAAAALAEAQ